MSNRLQGKVALVTAAGQGIGRAIAEKFAAEGARLIATDLDADKLAGLNGKTRQARRAVARSHLRLRREIGREFGALDILVNCAGYVHQGTVFECTDKDWDFSFDLNVKSMHHMLQDVSAADAGKEGRLDRQHRVGGVVDPWRAEPLRLRRDQGRGDRADQGCRRRFHQAGHPLQCGLSGHDRIAVARRTHRRRCRRKPDARRRGAAGFRRPPADGPAWHTPRKSPGSRSFSPATSPATLPARRISSMAAWRCSSPLLRAPIMVTESHAHPHHRRGGDDRAQADGAPRHRRHAQRACDREAHADRRERSAAPGKLPLRMSRP